jgi:hypothetical protein
MHNDQRGPPKPPTRPCERCKADMTFVGSIPKIATWPELHTFRCPRCDHVASVEVEP